MLYKSEEADSMTNEELVVKIQNGQTELNVELWLNIEKFVYAQSNLFFRNWQDRCQKLGVEKDDLYQTGWLALILAVPKYNEQAGASFIYYFAYFLKTQFYRMIKLQKRNNKWLDSSDTLSRAESFDKTVYENKDGVNTTIEDYLADEMSEQEIYKIESIDYINSLRKDLNTAVSSLSLREADILISIYFKGLRARTLAKKYNISNSRINSLHKEALLKLRRHKALKEYREELIEKMAHRTSFSKFKNSHTSQQEKIVMLIEEYEEKFNLK